jgi:hypothetical protein
LNADYRGGDGLLPSESPYNVINVPTVQWTGVITNTGLRACVTD